MICSGGPLDGYRLHYPGEVFRFELAHGEYRRGIIPGRRSVDAWVWVPDVQ